MVVFGVRKDSRFKDYEIRNNMLHGMGTKEPKLHEINPQTNTLSIISNKEFRSGLIQKIRKGNQSDGTSFIIHTTNDPKVWENICQELQGVYSLDPKLCKLSKNSQDSVVAKYNNNLKKPWMKDTISDQWSYQFRIDPDIETIKLLQKEFSNSILLTSPRSFNYLQLGISSFAHGMILFVKGDKDFEVEILSSIKRSMINGTESFQIQVFKAVICGMIKYTQTKFMNLEKKSWGLLSPYTLVRELVLVSQMVLILLSEEENSIFSTIHNTADFIDGSDNISIRSYRSILVLLLEMFILDRSDSSNFPSNFHDVHKRYIDHLKKVRIFLTIANMVVFICEMLKFLNCIINSQNLSLFQLFIYKPVYYFLKFMVITSVIRQFSNFLKVFIFNRSTLFLPLIVIFVIGYNCAKFDPAVFTWVCSQVFDLDPDWTLNKLVSPTADYILSRNWKI